MSEEKLEQAAELAENGDTQAARLLILEMLQANPRDTLAWQALIELATSDAERRKAIYQFWALEPANPEAQRLLAQAKAGKLPPLDEKIGLSSRNYSPKSPRPNFWQRLRTYISKSTGSFCFYSPFLAKRGKGLGDRGFLRFFSLIYVCLLFLLPTHAQDEPGCPGTLPSRLVIGQQARVIAEGGSNLRVVASSGSDLMNVIPQNELIPVIDGPYCAEGLAWWQVDYEGERGWIAEGLGEYYWLAPYVIQSAQIGTIRIETLPDLVSSIEWERLGEPLRSQFVFEGFPVSSPLLIPFIVIFDETSPEQLQALNAARTRPSAAQFLEIETEAFSGIRMIELYYPNTLEESTLIYHFMGQTPANHFIDAYFPLTAENLPIPYNANANYLAANAELIAAQTAFQPSPEALDLLLQSLRFDAPIEESALLHYDEGGISFDYNPILAYAVEQSFVQDTPPYIQLDFIGMEGENLRIYRSTDMQSSALASFQQSLSRQPNHPPQFPLEGERPDSEITYLSSGLRYLSDSSYFYFGLQNDYYIVFELPATLPTSALDAFVNSLHIGN